MPTIPPERPISSSWASMRLREFGDSACALQWLAISGASDRDATSQNPRSFRCARSTRIPRRLHSETRRLPGSVKPPPMSGEEGTRNATPSAKAFALLHTAPSERKPRADRRGAIAGEGQREQDVVVAVDERNRLSRHAGRR